MPAFIEMPKLSDTMTEGTLVAWRKSVGDRVEVGEIVAEIETDKAVMEMEAFDEGVLEQILVHEGETVHIGQRLAVIAQADDSATTAAATSGPAAGSRKTSARHAAIVKQPAPDDRARQHSPGSIEAPPTGDSAVPPVRHRASPLAKHLAQSAGVPLASLTGTGPGGRIVAQDVRDAATEGDRRGPLHSAVIPALPATAADRRLPLTPMRRAIADRLRASKQQIPHFYVQLEIDAGELVRFRAHANASMAKVRLEKLTLNGLLLKAAAAAAIRVPRINAAFAEDSIIEYGEVHLAFAVALEDGLVTPVIRGAQKLSLLQISAAVKDLAERARSRGLAPRDYQGGTLTVSNLGASGVEHLQAIITPPQPAILSVGAVTKKPVLNANDEIVVGHRLSLGLSADHRVIDGAAAAQYLNELRLLLEHPPLLLF